MSEEAREQIALIVDGPVAGKAEAFLQPQHRFEPGDDSARLFGGLEAPILAISKFCEFVKGLLEVSDHTTHSASGRRR